jgi:Tol biopolymer transport system component
MGKLAGTFFMWLLVAALLSACGPGDLVGGTPGGTLAAETSGTEASPAPPSTPAGQARPPQPPAGTPKTATAGSACQGRLAFAARTNGDQHIFVIDADGSGLLQITRDGGWDRAPTWSPDGDSIAFERHEGNTDLYIASADGSELLRLTELPSREFAPTWSPGGEQLVFASQSGYSTELYAVSARGGEAYALTGSSAHKPELAWSPLGSLIAFTMYDGTNQGDIWLTAAPDFRGSGPVNLTQHPANDCCADWSPDGEWLLFLSSRNQEGTGSLWPRSRSLLAQAGADRTSNTASDVVRPLTTVMPEATEDIYLVRPSGSQLVRLTNGTGRERNASWSPVGAAGEGRIAFVSDVDGRDELYVIDVHDGVAGTLTRLTDGPEDKGFPAWSPDGACLAFQQYRDREVELYVVNADGSGLTKLAENLIWASRLSWTPQ